MLSRFNLDYNDLCWHCPSAAVIILHEPGSEDLLIVIPTFYPNVVDPRWILHITKVSDCRCKHIIKWAEEDERKT